MLERPISKAGWRRVAFGDVVRKVNDKVDPWDSGLERYVAGEHMDTDDLRIRRWGLIGDDYLGPAFHMRFKPGHVLYGSRRTYLRKVALADFEGITANTTFVLETKDPARLMPDLLPFLMQTEAFHSYSIKHSKGSVNPYINFSDLEAFEFLLPPIQEQARLVEALSASEAIKYAFDAAIDALIATKAATEKEVISRPLNLPEGKPDLAKAKPEDGWRILTGQDLLDFGYLAALQDGNHGSQYPTASELGSVGYPYLSATDITDDGEIDLESCRRIRPERATALRIPPAQTGDIVLSHNATVGRVTRLPEWPTPIVASTSTTYYRCNSENLDPDYLRWFLESSVFKYQLSTIMRQSTRNQVPITTQKRLLFAIPGRELQAELSSLRDKFVLRLKALQARKASAQALQKKILEAALV
ncbi:restriction endonuclease subunit S [Paracoccus sp. MA]|uniref:restriction endonuclease subunit S n=1 Tax=Paracoccus sp. MA TaxID=2895796 RepID=UPI001E367845|nr:restriction endonuclease subunit S [Paracoccus sp. MA]UFM64858.1 restriction endonuclease subunit S [Paracoccus sp. MA]